ncbi:hypothetical protein AWJ20_3485 [Sugiyamaella lignohabitans]|uniref:Uncharacterized protein n=1 Tax=Sugiyamaella lignohabitans TaxID=796027 RepID=A0A167FXV5_9ASCO|nr:uncharacterized protein AWJ20_3485 [Sugiyamaella lignohabitans]ANB15841.1 hypothetical protein AWJ20_3485 [Sugiyamaella lignohabitans]
MIFFSASIRISSPSSTKAIGPPSAASGTIWPMRKPWEPPLNLPSVRRATSLPKPYPIRALEGLSISGIPGPPFGPSYLMTTTVLTPFLISPFSSAAIKSSSSSNTRAVPWKKVPSLPVILPTDPPGASEPRRICKCPLGLRGFDREAKIVCSFGKGLVSARVSFIVLPVTDKVDPSRIPCSSKVFMTEGVPPY